MNKICFSCLFFLLINSASAQYSNSIEIGFLPIESGWGGSYSHVFKIPNHEYKLGFYGALAFGDYQPSDIHYLNNHVRGSFGLVFTCPDPSADFAQAYLSLGPVIHHYGPHNFPARDWRVYAPVSYETGFGIKLEWFAFILRYDWLKGESMILSGITFPFAKRIKPQELKPIQ